MSRNQQIKKLFNFLSNNPNIGNHVQQVSQHWKQNLSNARNLAYKRAYQKSTEIENILKKSFSAKVSKALVNYLVFSKLLSDLLSTGIISPWGTLKKENAPSPEYLLKIKDVMRAAQNYAEKTRLLLFIKETEHYLDEQRRKKVFVNRVPGSSSHNALKLHGVERNPSERNIRSAVTSSRGIITEFTKRKYPGFKSKVNTCKGPFNTQNQINAINRKGKGKAISHSAK